MSVWSRTVSGYLLQSVYVVPTSYPAVTLRLGKRSRCLCPALGLHWLVSPWLLLLFLLALGKIRLLKDSIKIFSVDKPIMRPTAGPVQITVKPQNGLLRLAGRLQGIFSPYLWQHFCNLSSCPPRPKDAFRAIKKRLAGNKNFHEVMLALTVGTMVHFSHDMETSTRCASHNILCMRCVRWGHYNTILLTSLAELP